MPRLVAWSVRMEGYGGPAVANDRAMYQWWPWLARSQMQSLFAGIFGASPPTADVNDQATAVTKISA
jgi:hypothetical protein